MKPILVEFAPQSVWTAPLIAWALLCSLACVALSLKAGIAWEAQKVAVMKSTESQSTLAMLDARMRDARNASAKQKPPSYLRDAQELAQVAGFPTQVVLRSLESTAVDNIRINSIALQPAQRSAEVTLEFMDYQTLLSYVQQLNEGQPNATWMLMRAQVNAGKKLAVIRYMWKADVAFDSADASTSNQTFS